MTQATNETNGGAARNIPVEGGPVRYPRISVRLTATDGNAFAVLGAVTAALRAAGAPREEADAFVAEATAGDYDHLLATCMRWVEVE